MTPTRFVIALVVTATTATLSADTVTLNDGSTIVGSIKTIAADTITIESASVGTLQINREHISGFSTDEPRTVELTSGERVIGRVIQQGDRQRIEGQSLQPVTVTPADITAAWLPGEESPEARNAREALERREWTGSLFFGLNGQTGTTEKLTFNGRIDLKQDLANQRTFLYAQTRFSEENGSNSVNENIAGARMEFDISEKWFVYGASEVENDEQEDLDLRASLTAGLGYFLIRDADTEFKLRAGAGLIHESFGNGDNSNDPLFEAGYDYKNILWDDVAFTHSMTYLPTLDDFASNYRINFDTAAEWAMGNNADWKLRLGMQNKYDNAPAASVERLDTWYYLNLGYAW